MTDAQPPQLSWAERFRGAMLGGAVGDALGAGVRNTSTAELQQWFGPQGVVDYLPVFGRRGAVSDLTQLTVFTMEALLRAKAANPGGNGWLPTEFVFTNYLRWLHTQGVPWDYAMSAYLSTEPAPNSWLLERSELYSTRNPEGAAISLLGRMARQSPLGADGLLRPPTGIDGLAGCVAWAAPAMVWSNVPEAVYSTGAATANLFTSAPNSVSAAGMHADVLAQLIRGVPLWDAVTASDRNRLGSAYQVREIPADVRRTVHAAMFVGQRGVRPSPSDLDIEFDTYNKPGELGIALAAVGSTRNFADAVRVAVNQSSDSAVTGALAGQLAGAIYGPGGIPAQWGEELELREVIEILCADATEAFAPPPPPQWAQRYAPNNRPLGGPRELAAGTPNTVEGSAEQTMIMPAITAAPDDAVDTPPQGIAPQSARSESIGAPTFPAARTEPPAEFTATDPSSTGPIPVPRLLSNGAPVETTAVFPAVDTPAEQVDAEPQIGAFPPLAAPRAAARAPEVRATPAESPAEPDSAPDETQAADQDFGRIVVPEPDDIAAERPVDGAEVATGAVEEDVAEQGLSVAGTAQEPSLGAFAEDVSSEDQSVTAPPVEREPVDMEPPARAPIDLEPADFDTTPGEDLPDPFAAAADPGEADEPEADGAVFPSFAESFPAEVERVEPLGLSDASDAGEARADEPVLGPDHIARPSILKPVVEDTVVEEAEPEPAELESVEPLDADPMPGEPDGIEPVAAEVEAEPLGPDHIARPSLAEPTAPENTDLEEVVLQDAVLDDGVREGAVLKDVVLKDGEPEDAVLQDTEREEVKLADTVLQDAVLGELKLQDAEPEGTEPEEHAEVDEREPETPDVVEAPQAATEPKPAEPAAAVQPIVRGEHAKADRPDDSAPSLTERVLGCFLGGALGDALGADLEFITAEEITKRFGTDGPSGLREAYGVHGAITDDTQMTLFTAEGLIRGSVAARMLGAEDPLPEVQLAYQRWLHTQGVEWDAAAGRFLADYPAPDGWLIEVPGLFKTRAPGKTVFRALARFGDGHPAGSFTEKINDSKGCGGVMRAAPAALCSTDPAEVFRLAARTAALTHSHPAGYHSAGALAVIVQQALLGRGLDDGVWLALQVLETWEDHEETSAMLKAAVDLAEAGVPTPQQVAETLGGGWVGEEALAIAVCAALVGGEDVELALRIAVHHDGDSDSTGAICGNIVGALLGVGALPVDWLAELELRDVVEQVALDCVAEFGRGAFQPGPAAIEPPTDEDWNERYPARPQWSVPEPALRTAGDEPAAEFPAPKPAPRRINGVVRTETFEGEGK
ncbi:ADP-ribosylglycohydrolase family protein [Saccharopolyspora sp. NPDC050642]|uniref:ADP-ribosylglycohydrolase family protein n=1 Tax=Saccharopolyspora sp. NPDC050642 TaxID=3157099 RepID=UPI0033D11483